MKKVTVEECQTLLQQGNMELIDVREPWEVEICAIGGTKIPMHQVTASVTELNKKNHYVIVCKTGRRAEAVANLLEAEYGFENISVLEGGITQWFALTAPSYEMY